MTGPGDKGGPKGERLRLSSYEDDAAIERVADAPGAPGEGNDEFRLVALPQQGMQVHLMQGKREKLTHLIAGLGPDHKVPVIAHCHHGINRQKHDFPR